MKNDLIDSNKFDASLQMHISYKNAVVEETYKKLGPFNWNDPESEAMLK